MPDAKKYRNTTNLGREDENKMGWKLGQIVHVAHCVTANRYEYCGYPEMEIPGGARARLIGIKQTDLNACHHNGVGDVYVDFELLDYTNEDGTAYHMRQPARLVTLRSESRFRGLSRR
jgi:hypothetical protein